MSATRFEVWGRRCITTDAAWRLALRICTWLADERIIAPHGTRMRMDPLTCFDFEPGPQFARALTPEAAFEGRYAHPSWAEIRDWWWFRVMIGRQVINNHCRLDDVDFRAVCPSCGRHWPLSALAGAWDLARARWAGGEPDCSVTCPHCGHGQAVNRVAIEPRIGFVGLTFNFDRWLYLDYDFIQGFADRIAEGDPNRLDVFHDSGWL